MFIDNELNKLNYENAHSAIIEKNWVKNEYYNLLYLHTFWC